MQLNGHIKPGSQFHEVNVEKEAAEMASRIMEKVRQKSNVKSSQRGQASNYLRASDYKSRQSELSNNRLFQGTISATDRNDFFEPHFKQTHQPILCYQDNLKQLENVKTPQKLTFKSNQVAFTDNYQKTVKLNNYYHMEPQSQSSTDKPDSTKLIKLMDSVNSMVSSKRDSSPKHRKIDSITHAKSNLIHTPIKYNKEDIVSQLLGSLKNSKKYSEYKNSEQK